MQAGLTVEVESAGTSAYHQGALPDKRSVAAAEARGYHFKGIHARAVKTDDFRYYDRIYAMDQQNLLDLQQRCPAEYQHKLALFLCCHPEFDKQSEVPDPYYGGLRGFELVLDLIEQGCTALIEHFATEQNSVS